MNRLDKAIMRTFGTVFTLYFIGAIIADPIGMLTGIGLIAIIGVIWFAATKD